MTTKGAFEDPDNPASGILPQEHPDYDGLDTNAPYNGHTEYVDDPVSGIPQPVYVPGVEEETGSSPSNPSGGGDSTQPSSVEEEAVLDEFVPTAPTDDWFKPPEDVPIPGYDPNAIQPVDIDEAPAYEQSQAQQEWARMQAEAIANIVNQQGIGIDEATQQLMKQQTWDLLKADRDEKLRRLNQNMETRGITSSGLRISEEMKIHANATRSLAASVTEVKIKSAFLKMASFENALGLSAKFLDYLDVQDQLRYAPKLATWSKRADAKIAAMAASVEVYKVNLQQAYAVNNMNTAAKIEAQFATQQNAWNVEAAEIEMEFATEQAKLDRNANIMGTILGGISGLFV